MEENDLTGKQPDGAAAPKPAENVAVQEAGGAPLVSDPESPATPAAAPEDGADDGAHAADDEASRPALSAEEKRIAQEAFAKRAQQRENKRLADENKRLADELAAFKAAQAPPKPNADDRASAAANAPEGGYRNETEFNNAVQQEATRRAQADTQARAEAEFTASCNTVFNKGVEAYKDDFQQAVANLQSVGVMSREMLEVILATEDPAKVLYDLGSDPDKASALLDMTPAKRAIEIAKLSVAVPKKADPLSNAPAPIRPVEGTAQILGEPRDDDDDATWYRKRLAQRQRRQA